jgi:hypothetical protein
MELRRNGEGTCGLHEAQFQALTGLDSAMLSRLKEGPAVDPDKGNVHVSGSHLPSHSAVRRCILTGKPIRVSFKIFTT